MLFEGTSEVPRLVDCGKMICMKVLRGDPGNAARSLILVSPYCYSLHILLCLSQADKTLTGLQINAERHSRLIGALQDDCQPGSSAAAPIVWTDASQNLPACNVPGFSELYEIPSGCSNFAQKVERVCGIPMDDVLVVSHQD